MANRFGKSVLAVPNPRLSAGQGVRPKTAAWPGEPGAPEHISDVDGILTMGASGWPTKGGRDHGGAATGKGSSSHKTSGKSWNSEVSKMPDEHQPMSRYPRGVYGGTPQADLHYHIIDQLNIDTYTEVEHEATG